MNYNIFSQDIEKTAEDFSRAGSSSLDIIPSFLGTKLEFWVKLIEFNPELISRVPDEIIESEEFAAKVNHQLFYEYLSKRYLTVEDFYEHKEKPEKAIRVRRDPSIISNSNKYVTYDVKEDGSICWIIKKRKASLKDITNMHRADEIPEELWNQEFADELWASEKALVSMDYIPPQYVRREWQLVINLYKEKRYPLFGSKESMKTPLRIPEYWCGFKTEADILLALDLEKMVNRCQNPWNYCQEIFVEPANRHVDFDKIFSELWEAIKEMAKNNQEITERMFELYGYRFSHVLPRAYFNMKWLWNSEDILYDAGNYKFALEDINKATCVVERLEAEECARRKYSLLRHSVLDYISLEEEELNLFIQSYLENLVI